MKKATVTAQCKGKPQAVTGYSCQVAGLDMVVHRLIREGGRLHTKAWTVTEPRTGLLVASDYGRSRAIEAAEAEVVYQGGRGVLDCVIKEKLADQAVTSGA